MKKSEIEPPTLHVFNRDLKERNDMQNRKNAEITLSKMQRNQKDEKI